MLAMITYPEIHASAQTSDQVTLSYNKTGAGYVNSTTGLYVRESATTSSRAIASLSNDEKIMIIERLSNGWYKIQYDGNGNMGYVYGSYVRQYDLEYYCQVNTGGLSLNQRSGRGTTATCSVSVSAEKVTDKIEVSVQLVCGSDVVAEWTGLSGTGTFRFNETASVKRWKTYTMKTTCSINGKSYPVADITKKCK